MSDTKNVDPPSFLSLEFHTRFFPLLLMSRLRREKNGAEATSFNNNLVLTLMLLLCVFFTSAGIPMIAGPHPFFGWALSALGIAGILFVVISSIAAQWGTRPTYSNFLAWIFLFFLLLGFTTGLFTALENHSGIWLVLAASFLGLIAGYGVGLFAGFWAQSLGWISSLLNGLAGLGVFGLLIVFIVFLFGGAFPR
jgi:hypothetical protein